ncbi:cysteine-rich with EGF-like domain protein 2-A [Physella acuta]|uniref:cysteine-rich with EGF-like domain protein 2-A n=1 Tax=Physella acuta TaxID=109671 RepID=UPI0027DD4CCD|nr:cysteine-rich with EGF-like domain protein 2-A [Physella acuta]
MNLSVIQFSKKLEHNICLRMCLNLQKMLFILWVILLSVSLVDGKRHPKCSICKEIANNFHKGLSSTSKSNFGGGNTKWEEKSLGTYATSEVRLTEILEHLCDEGSKECHSVLEEHEELVERFWFKEFAQKKATDFFTYICIENMEACCPNNTYGEKCTPCPGGIKQACSGNGHCQGEGTREGDGKCSCNSGYRGELCNECKDGYYEESANESQHVCKVCHISCKDTCSEGGPKGCDECKDGWTADEELGCLDVNECSEDPCDEGQFCTNTQGSFTCFTCDAACLACTGSGADKCIECNTGFTRDETTQKCVDNDECEKDENICQGENVVCKNIPGSYECVCKPGFVMREGVCVQKPKETNTTTKKLEHPNLAEELKKNNSKRKELDWAKFKDIPSVASHFLIVALYGISCRFASSSYLASFALSVLLVIHVVWFAIHSK